MIKKFSKTAVATLLIASSLSVVSADDTKDTYDVRSLIGFEAGYSAFDYERTTAGVVDASETVNLAHAGVKIGDETNDYRVFLSARALDGGDFDYARAYGIELQYLLNVSKMANVYFGVNTGIVDMRFDEIQITEL